MTERDPLREALKDDAEYRRHAVTDPDTIREALRPHQQNPRWPDPGCATCDAQQALARLEAEMEADKARIRTLEDAGRAVVNEWNWPDEDPPSETYFHNLVETLHDALADAEEKP